MVFDKNTCETNFCVNFLEDFIAKKLLPHILNLITITIRDILRAQKFIFVCRLFNHTH